MMKPRKAYLVEKFHAGFGFRVSPVLVVDHTPGGTHAHVVLLNVSEKRAWVPTLAASPLAVRVADLASTRLRALAKVALHLADIETELSAHIAMTPPAPPAAKPVAGMTAAESSRPAPPPRRNRLPWYQTQ